MPMCCAVDCKNTYEHGIKMYKIPSGIRDQERRNIWLSRINRKNFSPSKRTVLCEAHFEADQFEKYIPKKLKPNAVPTLFSHIPRKKTRKSQRVDHEVEVDKINRETIFNQKRLGVEHAYANKDDNFVKHGTDNKVEEQNHETNKGSDAPVVQQTSSTVLTEISLETQPNNVSTLQLSKDPQAQKGYIDYFNSLKKQILLLQKKLHLAEKHIKTLQENCSTFFNMDQIQYLKHSKDGGAKPKIRWSEETIVKASQLLFSCGLAGYQTLIDQGYPLPCERTLRRKIVHTSLPDCDLNEDEDEMFGLSPSSCSSSPSTSPVPSPYKDCLETYIVTITAPIDECGDMISDLPPTEECDDSDYVINWMKV